MKTHVEVSSSRRK